MNDALRLVGDDAVDDGLVGVGIEFLVDGIAGVVQVRVARPQQVPQHVGIAGPVPGDPLAADGGHIVRPAKMARSSDLSMAQPKAHLCVTSHDGGDGLGIAPGIAPAQVQPAELLRLDDTPLHGLGGPGQGCAARDGIHARLVDILDQAQDVGPVAHAQQRADGIDQLVIVGHHRRFILPTRGKGPAVEGHVDAADLAARTGALGDQLVLGKRLAADLVGLAKVALADVVGGQRPQFVQREDVGRRSQLVVLFHGVGVQHPVIHFGIDLFVLTAVRRQVDMALANDGQRLQVLAAKDRPQAQPSKMAEGIDVGVGVADASASWARLAGRADADDAAVSGAFDLVADDAPCLDDVHTHHRVRRPQFDLLAIDHQVD